MGDLSLILSSFTTNLRWRKTSLLLPISTSPMLLCLCLRVWVIQLEVSRHMHLAICAICHPILFMSKKANIVLKRCRALHMLNSSMSLALNNMCTQVYAKLTNILYVCVCVTVHAYKIFIPSVHYVYVKEKLLKCM